MTNYNDGKWHGWNGGKCPVHPLSHVEVLLYNSSGPQVEEAEGFNWLCDSSHLAAVVAFRVVNEYREPRSWWIIMSRSGHAVQVCVTETEAKAVMASANGRTIIHVREVLE